MVEPINTTATSPDVKVVDIKDPAIEVAPSKVVVQDPDKISTDDILSRVNKDSTVELVPDPSSQNVSFNVNDIEKISDPVAKKYAEDAYKSFQADYTKKTQEISETRKELEALKRDMEQNTSWTPDRIKELLNDPTFVQAAQQVSGPVYDDEWSNLNDSEKLALKQRDDQLKSVMSELNSIKTQAEDEKLTQKYANYDSSTVNQLQIDLLTGKYQATREDIYKVANFEREIKRAYQLGLKDRQSNLSEKLNGSTEISPASVTLADQIPDKQPKENTVDYFRKLALRRIQSLGQK